MSNTFFEHQVIPQNSSTSPVENLASEVATAFTSVENLLGTDTIYPSLNKVIGNFILADLSYHGVAKLRSDTFTISDSTKDLVLSYIPTSNISVSYLDDSQNTIYLTEKQPTQEFTDKNQFKTLGRVLVLSGSFVGKTLGVNYTGLEPTLAGDNVKPNVLKEPNGIYLKPLVEVDSNTYTVTYTLDLQTNTSQYLNGDTSDKSKIFLIAKTDEGYKVLNYDSLVFNNNIATFTFDTPLDQDYDEVLVYILNVTIADLLEAIYLEFKGHDHSKDAIENVIDHKNIINNYQNTSKIYYKDSQTPNYSHPQSLNREGYNSTITSAYENSMLGDLFLAALISDSDQTFKSLTKNSAKLLFGDPVAGSKLYFDSTLKSLNILTGSDLNGLNISVGVGKKALSINDTNTIISESPDSTQIKGKGNVVEIVDDGLSSAVFKTKYLQATAKATLYQVDTDTITIGNTRIVGNGATTTFGYEDDLIGGTIVYEATASYNNISVLNGSFTEINLIDKIKTSDQSFVRNNDGAFSFNVNGKFVDIEQTSGKTSGYQIGYNGIKQKTYSSNYLGVQGTAIDTSFFTESYKDADVYFIKDTSQPILYKGITYSFQQDSSGATRVDSLKEWVRSAVYVGDLTGYSLKLNPSTETTRNGLTIGETRLSVIGPNLDCPVGTTILESYDTIHFVKPLGSDADTDCKSITYQGVNTGNLQVFGDAAFDSSVFVIGNITTGETVTTSELVVNTNASIAELLVTGESTFSGKTEFIGAVEISNNLDVTGALDLSGSLNSSDGTFTKFVSIGETLTVGGQAIFDDNVIVQGSLYTNENFTTQGTISAGDIKAGNAKLGSVDAQGSISAIGGLTIEGPAVFKGNLDAAGNMSTKGNLDIEGEITGDSLYITSDTTLMGRLVVDGSVNISTESFTVGSTNASLLMYGSLQVTGARSLFSGEVNIQGGFVGTGAARFGSTVDISGALTAVSLKISSSATVSGNLIADSGEFTRKVYFQDGIKASGGSEVTTIVGTTATFSSINADDVYIRNTLSMGPDATISAYKVESAQFVQKDAGAISTFAGEVEFNSEVRHSSEGIVVGNSAIKTTRNTSGCYITDNSIILGNNSTIKAVKIFADKGTPSGGNKDLNAGFCFANGLAQGGEDGDTGLFATLEGSGIDGSNLEIWIDGAKKYTFYRSAIAFTADPLVYGKAVVTLEILAAFQSYIERKISSGTASVTAAAWPVGSIYITMNDANPYVAFQFGTWVRFAPGRTLVGRVTGSTSEQGGTMSDGLTAPAGWTLNTTGATYGEFVHKLTEAEIPAHAHSSAGSNVTGGTESMIPRSGGQGTWSWVFTGVGRANTPDSTFMTSSVGSSQGHNIVQPSIVVNMWHRIA